MKTLTLTALRQHRNHIAKALEHYQQINHIETTAEKPHEMQLFAMENHGDLLRWELEQAHEALWFCRKLNCRNPLKRWHVASIAGIRLARMERLVRGVRIP